MDNVNDGYYTWLFWSRKLRRFIKKIDNEYQEKYGLKNTEMEILFFLHNNPSASIGEISRGQGLNKAQVSMAMNTLKEKGYVEITESTEDKRYLIYSLTPSADTLWNEIQNHKCDNFDIFFTGFNEEEVEAFNILVKRISLNIDKILEEK